MRVITKNSMAVMIAIAVSGCNGDMLEMQSVDGMVPVEVKNVLSVDADITESRAGSPAVTSDGAKMGVFRIGDTKYTAQENVEYTYSSSVSKWTSTTPIIVSYQPTNLCAYYPYNSVTFTSGTTATLEATKYESGKDMSYASSAGATVTNQNPQATFAMKHAYARIKLAIKRSDSDYHGNCNISTVNLRNNKNFFETRTLNISTGSYGGSATVGGWTYTLNSGDMVAGSTNKAYDVLVPPQTMNSGLKITLVVDGVERSATIPADSFGSNLTAGSQYSINLLLSDTEVIPSSDVQITEWQVDNATIVIAGEGVYPKANIIKVPASEINQGGSNCTASDKTHLGSLSWAGGNIKSTAGLGNPYFWSDNQNDFGYYYYWYSSYTTDSGNNATDPCSIVSSTIYGSGWRLPHASELEMLVRCTDKVSDGMGMMFLNSTKGLYLPFAGYRTNMCGTEATDGKGEGYYWASEDWGVGGGPALRILSSGEVSVVQFRTLNGASVRCVRGPE